MQYKFLRLTLTKRSFAPSDGGLYVACRSLWSNGPSNLEPLYVGQAGNRRSRIENDLHEGLARAYEDGGHFMLYSPTIDQEQTRRDYETLFRREFMPPANREPIPSLRLCIEAANRLGEIDIAEKYRRQMFRELSKPNHGFKDTSRLFGRSYANAFDAIKNNSIAPPLNAFCTLRSGFDQPLSNAFNDLK